MERKRVHAAFDPRVPGDPAPQEDFLAGALRREECEFGLIGVHAEHDPGFGPNVRSRGRTARLRGMPVLRASAGFKDLGERLCTRAEERSLDGRDGPQLSDAAGTWGRTDDEAADRLLAAARAAALRTLGGLATANDDIAPSWEQYRDAQRMGIALKPARPRLAAWRAPVNGCWRGRLAALELTVARRPLLRMRAAPERLDAHALQAALGRADAQNEGPLVLAENRYLSGYDWYKRIPAVDDVEVVVRCRDGTTARWRSRRGNGDREPLAAGPVAAIAFELGVREPDGRRRTVTVAGGQWICTLGYPHRLLTPPQYTHALPQHTHAAVDARQPAGQREHQLLAATQCDVEDETEEQARRQACREAAHAAADDTGDPRVGAGAVITIGQDSGIEPQRDGGEDQARETETQDTERCPKQQKQS